MLITFGTERIRALYLSECAEGRTFGPHPYTRLPTNTNTRFSADRIIMTHTSTTTLVFVSIVMVLAFGNTQSVFAAADSQEKSAGWDVGVDGLFGLTYQSSARSQPGRNELPEAGGATGTSFGARFFVAYNSSAPVFGVDGFASMRLEIYGHSNFFMPYLPFAILLQYSCGLFADLSIGSPCIFFSLRGGFALDGYWSEGPFELSTVVTVQSLQFSLAVGTHFGTKSSFQIGPAAAYLHYGHWAVGGHMLITFGTERIRALYLSQFAEGRKFGPHPFILLAYEWQF